MKEELIGLLFAVLWTIAVVGMWYWINFKEGAKISGEKIKNFHRKVGTYHKSYEIFLHPYAVKVYSTIFVLVGFLSIYLAIQSLT